MAHMVQSTDMKNANKKLKNSWANVTRNVLSNSQKPVASVHWPFPLAMATLICSRMREMMVGNTTTRRPIKHPVWA